MKMLKDQTYRNRDLDELAYAMLAANDNNYILCIKYLITENYRLSDERSEVLRNYKISDASRDELEERIYKLTRENDMLYNKIDAMHFNQYKAIKELEAKIIRQKAALRALQEKHDE